MCNDATTRGGDGGGSDNGAIAFLPSGRPTCTHTHKEGGRACRMMVACCLLAAACCVLLVCARLARPTSNLHQEVGDCVAAGLVSLSQHGPMMRRLSRRRSRQEVCVPKHLEK